VTAEHDTTINTYTLVIKKKKPEANLFSGI